VYAHINETETAETPKEWIKLHGWIL